jgi:prepilin-type N-terminal cleavage/methylation domain-containing protein
MFTSHDCSKLRPNDHGFSIIELLVAIVVVPIMIASISIGINAVQKTYALSRQYNEIYTVLSACPELDRALIYTSLSSSTNCYPNDIFSAENGGSGTFTYSPTLSVTPTSSLPGTDPLQSVPDSQVVTVSTKFLPPNTNVPALELRMLITRNGIGQQ